MTSPAPAARTLVVWSDDGESVTCPTCGESWADLWDYSWGNREEIRTECPHCDAPVVLHRSVSVDYGVSSDTTPRPVRR